MRMYKILQFLSFLSFLFFSSSALAISPDAYEDDDSQNQAKLILINESTGPQHHNFDSADDADWVKFYGAAGKTYLIRASNPGADCNAAFELYSSSGQPIQINTDPLTPYTVNNARKGIEESFQWICPANGFYFLKAYFAVPQNFSGDKTNYDLSVEDRTAPDLDGWISGLVQKASDHTTPIAGANVQVSSSNVNTTYITDQYGWYRSNSLGAGVYSLTVTANAYKPVTISVTVYDGKTSNGSVYMEDEPPKTYYKDFDNDGYSDSNTITSTTRPDRYKLAEELTAISGDYNDSDAAIHPGATEICDGKDNNCNGQIDENFPLYTYYRDADGDGYGDPSNSIQSCSPTPPAGYVTNKDDCNDSDSYNKGLISGSIINKCSGQKISPVKITVSGNGKSETIDAAGGNYTISFVPNTEYTVTFEADGYEKREFPKLQVMPCQNVPVTNIELTPVVKISGSITNKYFGQKISGVKITVSGNGKTETIDAADGNYTISFVPNIDYTVTFEAAGYEKLEFSKLKPELCQNDSEIDMDLTPIVNLSDVISILRIMSGISAEPPISFKDQKIEIFHAIWILQEISGLRK